MSVFETPWSRVQASLRAFLPCPECNGQGLVVSHYTDRDGIPNEDTDLCGECHGTGTEGGLMASEPVPEEAEERSPR